MAVEGKRVLGAFCVAVRQRIRILAQKLTCFNKVLNVLGLSMRPLVLRLVVWSFRFFK